MIGISTGFVKSIINKRENLQEILVEIEEKLEKALNFTKITGEVKEGDIVILNTTGVDLGLGSGGYHFVMGNFFKRHKKKFPGHIMKLRYTPYQFSVLSVEEDESPYKEKIQRFKSLEKLPVVIGELLSQVPCCAIAIKKLTNFKAKIGYIMTGSASLPIYISELIHKLKEKKIIDFTITTNQSFGGDYEAINIWTALIFAKEVENADVVIISQGLGSCGTNTKYGFSGIEQAEIINCVNILGGLPIFIPRISFAEKRGRHYGISHHSLTILNEISLTSSLVVLPEMEKEKEEKIFQQLKKTNISAKHQIRKVKANIIIDSLKDYELTITTMGRTVEEDKEFFLTSAAAGILAVNILKASK